jgi:trimethylamine--corrinoid protein Co-methyltransferase
MKNLLVNQDLNDLKTVHDASMRILEKAGVSFPGGQALELFKNHGVKTEGDKVFLTEQELFHYLSTVPKSVQLIAREPKKSLLLGGLEPVFLGTTGAPNFLAPSGQARPGTLADYDKFQKLSQTSPLAQLATYKAIFPQDVPAKTAYLDMLFSTLTLTDLVAGGDSQEVSYARDTIEMLSMVFGSSDYLKKNTVIRGTINVLSPLRYAPEQSASLLVWAENNQLSVVTNMAMMGLTSPMDVPSSLALGNAEILAGVVLTQLARPGAPVIYGSTSCAVDMKGMGATLGSPEALRIARGTIELAKLYGVPSRTGGGLTDGFLIDGQAAAESALALQNSIVSGANLIQHAFGMMGGYIAASLEKWVLDEEICAFILSSLKPFASGGEIDVSEIVNLGPGANYLIQPSTMINFRNAHAFKIFNKRAYEPWLKGSGHDLGVLCQRQVEARLKQYEKPPMDEQLEKELAKFIKKRKEELN